jgi:hypothetical protein
MTNQPRGETTMSTIQGSQQRYVPADTTVGALPTDDGSVSMGGDMLMKLYEFRLNYIQSRIESVFTKMNIAQKDTDALNMVQAKLAEYAGGVDSDAKFDDLHATIEKAKASLPPGDPMIDKLTQLENSDVMNTNGNGGTDKVLNADEVKSLTVSVDGMQKNIDTDSGKTGIELTQLSGQLNELNGLFANILSTTHQACMATINTIR